MNHQPNSEIIQFGTSLDTDTEPCHPDLAGQAGAVID